MRPLPRLPSIAAFVATGLLLAPASLLSQNALDSDDERAPFFETAHRANVAFEGGVALFTVRRRIRNRTSTPQALRLDIPLPGGATASGFRINTGAGWQQGLVRTIDEAAETYALLTTEGPSPRRTSSPALLQSGSPDMLALEVALVDARETIAIEYDLTAPTCYANNRHLVEVPIENDGEVETRRPTFRGRGVRVRTGDVELPHEHEELSQAACHGSHGDADEMVVLEAPAARGVGLRWTRSTIGNESLARLEFEIPTKLVTVPKRSSIVFVLDGGLSMPDSDLAGQLAVAKAIAAGLPNAQVQFVVYRRKAAVLLDRFVPTPKLAAALASVDATALEAANGSNLDAGLARAAKLLAERNGHVRIVAFTDSRLRRSFQNADVLSALATLPTDSVVHIVNFSPGGHPLEESTAIGHALEPIAHAHGGTVLNLSGQTTQPSALKAKTRHLIAPIRFDTLEIEAGGLFTESLDDVPLGVGYRGFAVAPAAPYRVRLRGRLWGSPWMVVANNDASYTSIAERLVAAATNVDLDDAQFTELALRSKVVSTYTSLLAASHKPVMLSTEMSFASRSYAST